MKHVLICTEGNSSEPGAIESFVRCLRGQAPATLYGRVEVRSLLLEGNHGYTKLVEAAEAEVEQYIKEWEIETPDDEIERFLVCDYDNIDETKTTLEALRESAATKGFRLIVTRPKFEYFIARHFFTEEELSSVSPAALAGKIKEGIDNYNSGKADFLHIPPYSKKRSAAQRCLGALYNFDPSFMDVACNINVNTSREQFTEFPKLLLHLKKLFCL